MPARLTKKFSARFINRTFFASLIRRRSAADINVGRCYDWAYYAYCLFPDVTLWNNAGHSWVQYQEKFYDSECPDGVESFSDIPCNYRNPWLLDPDEEKYAVTINGEKLVKKLFINGPCELNSEQFKSFWNKNGGGRREHWELMLEEMLNKQLPISRM